MTFLIGASFPLTALVPFIHVVPAPAESCSWDCFCSSRAPERNEAQSCWLRSQRGWQMRGNFIWARAANSGPNKLWITLCWVRLHKNSESFICWKTPRRTHRCLLHPYGRELEKHKMGQRSWDPAAVHLPAIHPLLSSTPADEHCKACPGTEPRHQQKGEINEYPRGNQVWSWLQSLSRSLQKPWCKPAVNAG